jgi:hypothetical protein
MSAQSIRQSVYDRQVPIAGRHYILAQDQMFLLWVTLNGSNDAVKLGNGTALIHVPYSDNDSWVRFYTALETLCWAYRFLDPGMQRELCGWFPWLETRIPDPVE